MKSPQLWRWTFSVERQNKARKLAPKECGYAGSEDQLENFQIPAT
jgi:hypothetical protein